MPQTYRPMTLETIDEGRFLVAVEEDLAVVQAAMLKHVERYGGEKRARNVEGAKAKLTVTIEIVARAAGDDDVDYDVVAKIVPTIPHRLPVVGKAQADLFDGALAVKKSGMNRDSPRQGRLTTDDGRVVDPETGEARERPSANQ